MQFFDDCVVEQRTPTEAKSSVEDAAVCSHVVMHVPLIVEKMFPLKVVVGQNLNGAMF